MWKSFPVSQDLNNQCKSRLENDYGDGLGVIIIVVPNKMLCTGNRDHTSEVKTKDRKVVNGNQ